MTGEVHETLFAIFLQRIAMQSAVVVAQAAVQRPAVAQALRGSGIDTEIKETVVRNQVLLSLVARLLIHAADTCRKFPTVGKLVGHIAQIVSQRVEFEKELVVVGTLLELLTAVLLITDDGLEIARWEV